MIDLSPWGLFWESIGRGQFDINAFEKHLQKIPEDITKIQYYVQQLSQKPVTDQLSVETAYVFLILQAASFGSKAIWLEDNTWQNASFRNYWLPTETSKRRSPVNPMMPMPKTIFNRVEEITRKMKGVNGYYGDIADLISVQDSSIVYIDPPYEGTTGYGHEFDIEAYVHGLTSNLKLHNKQSAIYVSEAHELSNTSYLISKRRRKGGISGARRGFNEEWLSRMT